MADKAADPVVMTYQPAQPGEGFPGVPQRDLTKSDVDALQGDALRHVLHPHPALRPLYVRVEKLVKEVEDEIEKAVKKPDPNPSTITLNDVTAQPIAPSPIATAPKSPADAATETDGHS